MFEGLWGYEHPLSGQIRRLEEELDAVFGSGASLTGTRNIRSLPAGSFPAVNVASTPEAILAAHPQKGSIAAVWAAWDQPALGALQAIKAAGAIQADIEVM